MPITEQSRFRRRSCGQTAELMLKFKRRSLHYVSWFLLRVPERWRSFLCSAKFKPQLWTNCSQCKNKGMKKKRRIKELHHQRVQLCAPFTAEVGILGMMWHPIVTPLSSFPQSSVFSRSFQWFLGSTGTHGTTWRYVVLDPSTRLLLGTLSKVGRTVFSQFLYLR